MEDLHDMLLKPLFSDNVVVKQVFKNDGTQETVVLCYLCEKQVAVKVLHDRAICGQCVKELGQL